MSQALLIPGIGRPNLQRLLFGANEQGWLYDWSDRSTMFQDPIGTLPVTASGQTVGLHLDKSKGLVLGPELVDISNLPTPTIGNFGGTTGGWDASTRIMSNTTTGTTGQWPRFAFTFPGGIVSGRHYRVSGQLTGDISLLSLRRLAAGGGSNIEYDATTGVLSGIVNSTADRIEFSLNTTIGSIAIQSLSIRELPGNHRYSTNADTRPQYVEDETGHYGLFDGVDDFFETNAIDFTATDKMTVWWGGRKLRNETEILLELSNTADSNVGTFFMTALTLDRHSFASKGTTVREPVASPFVPPVSSVLTGVGDISAPLVSLRANGSQRAQNTESQGAGNYGNHKLYFGRRGGVSFPANIREYMCIGRGAQTATPLIQRVEQEVRRKIKGLVW